jgi:shikimate dehydrogenase
MNLHDAVRLKTKKNLFVSLASKPGKTGSTFYNTLFAHHNIDAEYLACACEDLAKDIELAKGTCRGVSITMPFKLQIAKYVDRWFCEPGPVNTLRIDNKKISAYNCDILGLEESIAEQIRGKKVVILGSGAMSHNVISLCKRYNSTYLQVNRNNWDQRHTAADVLINCTSLGMCAEECPVDSIDQITTVIDCVIGSTKLISMAQQSGIFTITGAQIYLSQFRHQFQIYTGIVPSEQVLTELTEKVFNYV